MMRGEQEAAQQSRNNVYLVISAHSLAENERETQNDYWPEEEMARRIQQATIWQAKRNEVI